ncbi:hypothetical protein V498_10256, partial [Pseudogymnoascus sp. VKM F-4517 (FW-2822)]
MESKEEGWKERGVGNLKVNAHKTCVEFDDYTGALIPGSFDVSLRDDEDGPPVIAARLVMRQENTHRVILNTIINRALKLEEKPSNAAGKGYMFTAFDGITDDASSPVKRLHWPNAVMDTTGEPRVPNKAILKRKRSGTEGGKGEDPVAEKPVATVDPA